MSTAFSAPKVFVSYAWEDRGHKQWVKEIAVRLRVDGVALLLDQWELAPGDQLAPFMESSVREGDAVLIVCTPMYKVKSDNRAGGVGYEGSVITAELVAGAPRRKFIPLLRRGEWKDAAPSWLLGSVYLDFRGNGIELEDVYAELLETLHGRREGPPPVGSPPFPERHREEQIVSGEEEQRDLDGNGSSPAAYPFVLNRMLQDGRHDPELFEIGRQWLSHTDPSNPSWTFVWNSLLDARPDDLELREMGREWLLKR